MLNGYLMYKISPERNFKHTFSKVLVKFLDNLSTVTTKRNANFIMNFFLVKIIDFLK